MDEGDSRGGVKLALSIGAGVFFVAGLAVGVAYEVFFGVILLAIGVVALAIRGYMGSGDRAVTGALIFVAFAAVAIQAIEYFLVP